MLRWKVRARSVVGMYKLWLRVSFHYHPQCQTRRYLHQRWRHQLPQNRWSLYVLKLCPTGCRTLKWSGLFNMVMCSTWVHSNGRWVSIKVKIDWRSSCWSAMIHIGVGRMIGLVQLGDLAKGWPWTWFVRHTKGGHAVHLRPFEYSWKGQDRIDAMFSL